MKKEKAGYGGGGFGKEQTRYSQRLVAAGNEIRRKYRPRKLNNFTFFGEAGTKTKEECSKVGGGDVRARDHKGAENFLWQNRGTVEEADDRKKKGAKKNEVRKIVKH